jgi:hypothetical protein
MLALYFFVPSKEPISNDKNGFVIEKKESEKEDSNQIKSDW